MGPRGMKASAALLLCLLAAAHHPCAAARATDASALPKIVSRDPEPSVPSLHAAGDTTSLAVVLLPETTEEIQDDAKTQSHASTVQADVFDSEVLEDSTALALLALPTTRPLMPPETIHWHRWLGIRRKLGAIPTGSAALASALASMARAKQFTSFIALVQRSGWRPVMQQYIQRTPVTMLAPTDTAMKAIPVAYRKKLLIPKVATKFLQYHCLQQLWPYQALGFWKRTSPYPTALGPPVWRIGHKVKVLFGTERNTPVPSQAQIISADVSGKNLRLIIVEGINRALLHPFIFA